MDTVTRVQILEEDVCNRMNILGKCMNPTILPYYMGVIEGQIGLFNLGVRTNLEDGKVWIQIC